MKHVVPQLKKYYVILRMPFAATNASHRLPLPICEVSRSLGSFCSFSPSVPHFNEGYEHAHTMATFG